MPNQYTRDPKRHKEIDVYISTHFLEKSDIKLAEDLSMCKKAIYERRKRMGLKRPYITTFAPETIARVLEYFSNGYSIAEIGRLMFKPHFQINNIISRHFFYKKSSYDTVTLVIQSKINFE